MGAGYGGIRPLGGEPQNPVQFVFRREVVFAEIHLGGLLGAGDWRVFLANMSTCGVRHW